VSDQIHRFKVGDLVEIIRSTMRSAAAGQYEIVRLIPCDMEDPRYCLKSRSEKYERIVPEADLVAAPDPAAL
jgi:hypothetical protein